MEPASDDYLAEFTGFGGLEAVFLWPLVLRLYWEKPMEQVLSVVWSSEASVMPYWLALN